jgi:tRNA-2-methylthio-N6-dimethylallyladenosine synthase
MKFMEMSARRRNPQRVRRPHRSDALTEKRGLFIRTYGCQMNVYDSERMTEALGEAGYVPVERPEDAELVVLNTCHIREKAAEKVYSELGRIRQIAEARRGNGQPTRIGVAGCVAQAEGAEIIRRQPMVDLVVGPQAYHRLPQMVAALDGGSTGLVETEFPAEDKFEHLPRARAQRRVPTAFLTVQEGCDKFCAFCVVPYTRGTEVSRPVAQLLHEAQRLVDQGVREITLLGQNVNAYHGLDDKGREVSLAGLVRQLARIDGLARIRYTTSHPNDMAEDLIAAHAEEPKLMPYLHLPVQAGSDRVLKAMNRRHTAEAYLRLIERIRAARPDIALSGDFIVGFPGETEAEFEETLALARTVGYAHAFSFKYSARPGTPAAELPPIEEEVSAERLSRLQHALSIDQATFNAGFVGKRLPVLLEKRGREQGQLVGRTPYLQSAFLDAPDTLLGQIVEVEIEQARPNALAGALAVA